MLGKKIMMIVGDYVEDYEVMVPFQALRMVAHTEHAACQCEALSPAHGWPATTWRNRNGRTNRSAHKGI